MPFPFPFKNILLLWSSRINKKSNVFAKTYKQYHCQLSSFYLLVSRCENCGMDFVGKKHLQNLINAKGERLKFSIHWYSFSGMGEV